MATIDARLKLTYEDLELLPDDGKRHEIIDGDGARATPSRGRSSCRPRPATA